MNAVVCEEDLTVLEVDSTSNDVLGDVLGTVALGLICLMAAGTVLGVVSPRISLQAWQLVEPDSSLGETESYLTSKVSV